MNEDKQIFKLDMPTDSELKGCNASGVIPLQNISEYIRALEGMRVWDIMLNSKLRGQVPMREYTELRDRIFDFEELNEIFP